MRVFIYHHILNWMNNIGMALYFLPTIISSGSVNGGIRQRLLENFLWCCLNFGSKIKDIFARWLTVVSS